jgi:Holliday junction resolvase
VSNYRAGADLERAARKQLETDGYDVIRSAGSKGRADLAAFKPGQIVFVQCKVDGTVGRAERAEFVGLCARAGAVPLVAYWHKPSARAARVVGWWRVLSARPGHVAAWSPDYATEVAS